MKGAEGVVNARQILLSRSSQVPGDCHALDSGGKIVAMIKSADSGHENDSSIFTGIRFRDASSRRSFIQCQMRPVFMVIADILFQKSSQMTLVQHDDMIEQVPAAVANPALCNAILPWLRKLVRFGSRPSVLIVSTTSALKFAALVKIRYFGEES